jgi:acetoacetyl-CoA synthetase
VGQKYEDDERVWLFLKMKNGKLLDSSLLERIRSSIRMELSPRHVPSFIIATPDIPVYLLTNFCFGLLNQIPSIH